MPPEPGPARCIHASCAARDGAGVLITGASGAGKSDLLLRLIDRGFALVADDQVLVQEGWASPPPRLAGLIEVRGLGILRLPYLSRAKLALVASLGRGERLPEPVCDAAFGLPMIQLDPDRAAAPQILALALQATLGEVAFAA
jgi:HPr kinase/phosphorylase